MKQTRKIVIPRITKNEILDMCSTYNISRDEFKLARLLYTGHRFYSKNRVDINGDEIEFKLSFSEWYTIWIQSGFWDKRGVGRGKYCMSRFNDIGHYEIGNVEIKLNAENSSEYMSSELCKDRLASKRFKRPIYTNKGIFDCLKSAAIAFNSPAPTCQYWLKSKKNGFRYLTKEELLKWNTEK